MFNYILFIRNKIYKEVENLYEFINMMKII